MLILPDQTERERPCLNQLFLPAHVPSLLVGQAYMRTNVLEQIWSIPAAIDIYVTVAPV